MTILEQYVDMEIINEEQTEFGKLYSLPYETYLGDKLDTVSVSWHGALVGEDGRLIVRPHQVPTYIGDYPTKMLENELERGYLYVYDTADIDVGEEVNLAVNDKGELLETQHDTVTLLTGEELKYVVKPNHTVHGVWKSDSFLILSVIDNVKGWVLDYREMVQHYGKNEVFEIVKEERPTGDWNRWPKTYRVQSVEQGSILTLWREDPEFLKSFLSLYGNDFKSVNEQHGLNVTREYYGLTLEYVKVVDRHIDMDLLSMRFADVFDVNKPKQVRNTFEYNNLSPLQRVYVDKVWIECQEFNYFDDEIIKIVG